MCTLACVLLCQFVYVLLSCVSIHYVQCISIRRGVHVCVSITPIHIFVSQFMSVLPGVEPRISRFPLFLLLPFCPWLCSCSSAAVKSNTTSAFVMLMRVYLRSSSVFLSVAFFFFTSQRLIGGIFVSVCFTWPQHSLRECFACLRMTMDSQGTSGSIIAMLQQ